jgi:hypothetical protein
MPKNREKIQIQGQIEWLLNEFAKNQVKWHN